MSHTYNIRIADMTFCVTSQHLLAKKYCRDYLVQEDGEHEIVLTQQDIDFERSHCEDPDVGTDPELANASDMFLETIALLRKLADYVTIYNRILMHGSAIAINGKGYIFTALSGTGKSTHTAMLRKLHGENAIMINDDKPFLKVEDGQILVCGSPWMGKHHIGNNIQVPLGGIFFLRRSPENELKPISADDAIPLMVAQCHRPVDPVMMMNTLEMIDQILSRVALYDLGCNMDISAAELSSSVMK